MSNLLEREIYCPYCGEKIHVLIDHSDQGQEYIEDCQVCCRPIIFNVEDFGDGLTVNVRSENDS